MQPIRVLYLAAIENPGDSPILEKQVIRLCEEVVGVHPDLGLSLGVFTPLSTIRRAGARERARHLRSRLASRNIPLRQAWLPLTSRDFYLRHRLWPLFLRSALMGGRWIFRESDPDIIHCRSYPATLLGLEARSRLGLRSRVIFDTRGMYPEEGVISGRWNDHSRDFLEWKRFERESVARCEAVVNVSQPHTELVRAIAPEARASTIPTVVDVTEFAITPGARSRIRSELGIGPDELVAIFSGSFSRWRDPATLATFYASLRAIQSPTRLLILTRSDEKPIRRAMNRLRIPPSEVVVRSLSPEAVPEWLGAGDLGILVEPETVISHITLGSKTGEYLAAGLPVLATAHCGGAAVLLATHGVGDTFDLEAIVRGDLGGLAAAVAALRADPPGMAERCRRVAREELDVTVAARRYLDLYEEVMVAPAVRSSP